MNVWSGFGLALAGYFLTSLSDISIKLLGGRFHVLQLVFVSTLVALVPLTVVMGRQGWSALRPRNPGWLAVRCLSGLVAGIGGLYAFTRLPLADVYTMLFLTPLLVTLLAALVLRERLRWHRVLAAGMGLAGVAVALDPGRSAFSLAHLAALIAPFAASVTAVILRKISADELRTTLTFYPTLLICVTSGAGLLLVWQPMGAGEVALVAGGSLAGVAAQFALVGAYRRAAAGVVAVFQYSQFVWALLFGWLLFADRPQGATLTGAALIIAGGVLLVWRERK